MMSSNELIIDLDNQKKSILKIGFRLQSIVFIICSLVFLTIGLAMLNEESWFSILFFCIAIVFFFISKNYFDNLIHKEQIIVTPYTITIVIKTSQETKHEFLINSIKYFGYANKVEFTKHPMSNDVVDFTGLATTEKVLQHLIDEGNIEIETDEKILRFGKNIASWDVDKIKSDIELFLNIKFKSKYDIIEIEEEEWKPKN